MNNESKKAFLIETFGGYVMEAPRLPTNNGNLAPMSKKPVDARRPKVGPSTVAQKTPSMVVDMPVSLQNEEIEEILPSKAPSSIQCG